MRKIAFIFYLCFAFLGVQSQQLPAGCDQSTTAINTVYYPNTSTNITFVTSNNSGMYLCGPNTIVYDTSAISTYSVCRSALVCANSTLVTNASFCSNFHIYFVKSNGTLIYKGYINNAVQIYYEPGATIIDSYSVVTTYSCSLISFPSINCSITNVKEGFLKGNFLNIYPNPTTDKLNLEFTAGETKYIKLNLYNSLNQLVYSMDKPSAKQELDLSFLASGIYYLKVQNTSEQKVFKIIKE